MSNACYTCMAWNTALLRENSRLSTILPLDDVFPITLLHISVALCDFVQILNPYTIIYWV